jgi:dihydroorotase
VLNLHERILTTMLILRTDRLAETLTAHHLYLSANNDQLAFCKPIVKAPSDRDALIRAACSSDPKFFL